MVGTELVYEPIVSLLFFLLMFSAVIPFISHDAQGYPGTFFAYTEYKSGSCAESYGELLTTDADVRVGSGDANFIDIEFNINNWMAVGWCEGDTPWGSTYPDRKFYWDQRLAGGYSGGLLGVADVNTWHSYRVMYQLRTTGSWNVYVDGVSKWTTNFGSYRIGTPTANVELKDTMDNVNCHVMNLQYALVAYRFIQWYSWDGYGATYADPRPPLSMTIVSNTEWTCVS